MKMRGKLCAGVAFLAGLMCVRLSWRLGLFGWLRGEPCYRGLPVSSWRYQARDWRIDHWRRPESAEERRQEKEAPQANFVGVNGSPGRWTLEHRETAGQDWYYRWKTGNFRVPFWGNPDYGSPVCRLGILEGDPAAVPVLMALLKDEDVCGE